MGARTNLRNALAQIQSFPAKDATRASLWYFTQLFNNTPGLQVGSTVETPAASGTYVPLTDGETDGELYVSDDLSPAQVWVWQGGVWNSLSGGGGGGAVGVLYKDFMLGGLTEPYVGMAYTPTFVGGQLTQELWVDTDTSRNLKTIDYTYDVNGIINTEVHKVFNPADGVTIISQATNTYSFAGGILTGITKVRNV